MPTKNYALLAGALGMLFIMPATDAAPNVKPGLWEVTVNTQMPGMPVTIPPMKHRYCVRKEDLVPKTQQRGKECKVLDKKVTGNTVTWRVECKGTGMNSDGSGSISYAGDTYHGQMKMNMQDVASGPMQITQTLAGRRVGKCK